MWRKPNEVKPSSQPSPSPMQSSYKSDEQPKTPTFQSSSPVAPAASTPVSAPPLVSSNISKIGSGLKVQGEISGSADLYIDGDIQGKIRIAGGRVTVGPNGRIQAEIEAREIVVDGSVQGNLKAAESARLGSSSSVVGSVVSPRIGIDDGARLRGKIETVRTPQPAKVSVTESTSDPESEPLRPVTTGAEVE
ncbi:MAG TPA: polymer-forming cytoskeletal protein [Verrucomicrobiae bacterium]|nr:polymer-forming cytoskeletal protein [Verrucomicrobiae bacterium]